MTVTTPARNKVGQFRSRFEAQAAEMLFGDPAYEPRHPTRPFLLLDERISYLNLVKRLRDQHEEAA